MPIYEYKCRACGHEFEALILPPAKAAPKCAQCQSEDLTQVYSAFGVNSAERSESVFNAAQKKFEKTELRDKKVAESENIHRHLHEQH
jgi:putative FmdB family regulatory protein